MPSLRSFEIFSLALAISIDDERIKMPVMISGDRNINSLECPHGFLENYNGQIVFEGAGGKIVIKQPRRIDNFHLLVRSHSAVFVDEGLNANELIAHCWGEDSLIYVGKNACISGKTRIIVQESFYNITIGKNCLFADNVEIMCGDAHGMFDAASGMRINRCKDIRIGDHVWICAKVNILKGAHIGKDSVIGLGSIVTSSSFCPPGSVLAGAPARVVRSGVAWVI